MRTVRTSLVVRLFLLGLAAILVRPDAPMAAPGPQDALHQVMPGDSLRLIAGYYYGDTRQWERIWQANRDQVSNPNRIKRGALLRIPDVLPPDEPYADFLARTRRAIAPAAVPAKAEAPPAPEGELRTPGGTPSEPVSPRMEPTIPPGPGAPDPGRSPARLGSPSGPPAGRP